MACERVKRSSPVRLPSLHRPALEIHLSRKFGGIERRDVIVKNAYRIFRMALRPLRRNVMRSVLTCLGIVIGIAAVIAMMEIGQGSSRSIQQTIASLGANVIQMDPSDTAVGGVSSGGGGRVTMTPEDAEAIRRDCSAVRCVAPSVDCRVQIVYGTRNWSPDRIL